MKPVLLVHGGAGRVPEDGGTGAREGLEVAASLAWRVLEGGGPAMEAVLAAVQALTGGAGGLILLDAAGRAGAAHSTPFMAVARRGGEA